MQGPSLFTLPEQVEKKTFQISWWSKSSRSTLGIFWSFLYPLCSLWYFGVKIGYANTMVVQSWQICCWMKLLFSLTLSWECLSAFIRTSAWKILTRISSYWIHLFAQCFSWSFAAITGTLRRQSECIAKSYLKMGKCRARDACIWSRFREYAMIYKSSFECDIQKKFMIIVLLLSRLTLSYLGFGSLSDFRTPAALRLILDPHLFCLLIVWSFRDKKSSLTQKSFVAKLRWKLVVWFLILFWLAKGEDSFLRLWENEKRSQCVVGWIKLLQMLLRFISVRCSRRQLC